MQRRGCGTRNTERIPVESDIESGENGITLTVRNKERFVPLSFMLLEKDYSILCMRELSDEERKNGVIHEDFKKWNEKMSPVGRYQLAANLWTWSPKKNLSEHSIVLKLLKKQMQGQKSMISRMHILLRA